MNDKIKPLSPDPYNLTQSEHEANKAPQMSAIAEAMRALCDALPELDANTQNYNAGSRSDITQKMSKMADEIISIRSSPYFPVEPVTIHSNVEH